jgi:hypothetical protein
VRAFVALGAAVLVAGLLAGAATPRPAKATPKLTAAEKAALKIVSVEALGVPNLGLAVVVTFKGNLERAIGRGHLGKAAVALLVTAPGSNRPTMGVVTFGAGPVGKTLRRTPSPKVGVVRNGRELTFLLNGPITATGRIVVKSLAATAVAGTTVRAAANTSENPPRIAKEYLDTLNKEAAESEKRAEEDRVWVAEADCFSVTAVSEALRRQAQHEAATRDMLQKLSDDLADAIAGLEKSGGKLSEDDVNRIDRLIKVVGIQNRSDIRKLNDKGLLIKELRQLLQPVKSLIARYESLVKATEALAVAFSLENPPCSIKAVFSQADRTTTYSWGRDVWALYAWTLLPPANDPTCNNGGRLSGDKRTFAWYHGDDVCNHAREDPATGHIGVVTLQLKGMLGTTCKVSYFGTFTGTGPKGSCKVDKG